MWILGLKGLKDVKNGNATNLRYPNVSLVREKSCENTVTNTEKIPGGGAANPWALMHITRK